MADRNRRVPSYRLHKPSGQARVIIGGKHQYLGKYGTSESWEKYHQLVTEHLRGPANAALCGPRPSLTLAISINELVLAYWDWVHLD